MRSAIAFSGGLGSGSHPERHPTGLVMLAITLCAGVVAAFLIAPSKRLGSDPEGV